MQSVKSVGLETGEMFLLRLVFQELVLLWGQNNVLFSLIRIHLQLLRGFDQVLIDRPRQFAIFVQVWEEHLISRLCAR